MTQRSRPFETGLYFGTDGFRCEALKPRQLKFSENTRLADLAREYRFYTPAPVYCKVPLGGREPFFDFVQEYGRDVCPLTLEFQDPMFGGLNIGTDKQWDHVLFALEAEHWGPFCAWMGTLAFNDRDTDLLYRVRTQALAIADPIEFSKNRIVLPGQRKVPVTGFVLDTNRGCWYFAQQASGIPRLVHSPQSYADTLRFQQVLGQTHGTPDPYGAIEADRTAADPQYLWREVADRANRAKES